MLDKKHDIKYQLVTFFDIMEFTTDKLSNDKYIFPSFLKQLTMTKIKCWQNKKGKDDIKQTVETFAIRCSNCGKETMI